MLLLCVSMALLTWQFHHKTFTTVLTSDGVGYYSYLPAIFIYHDADFAFLSYFRENYQPVHEFIRDSGGEKVNQYFVGEATLLFPFFMASHLYVKVSGGLADGFSAPYQVGVMLAGLFYFSMAIWLLKRVLQHFSINNSLIHMSLLVIAWGTNLINYATLELCYSHVFSFFAFCLFLFGLVRIHASGTLKYWLCAAAGLGLIALIRPSNLLAVLTVPFFLQQNPFKLLIFTNKHKLVCAALLAFFIVFLQPLVWFWQTHHWLVDGYTTAKFNFFSPYLREVLISYEKGWWLYTPLAFVSLLGFWQVFSKKLYGRWMLLLYMLCNIWVISSWSYWHYGATFGQRSFVESYGIHAVLLLLLFEGVHKRGVQLITGGVIFLLVSFNMFQFMQYRMNIIHPRFMNEELYWKVFLKMGEKYSFMSNRVSNACLECPIVDTLGTWTNPPFSAVYEQPVSVNNTTKNACLVISGTVNSKLKDTNAYIFLELLKDQRVIGTQKVFMLRYLGKEEHRPLYHDMVLGKNLRIANQVRLSFHDWGSEIALPHLHIMLKQEK